MILRVIVLFLLKILDVIANAIAWLLVAFGLWIPAIYVIIFVVACAMMGVNLNSVGGIFWLGLALSTVLGVLVALRGIKKDMRKSRGDALPDKPTRSNISKVNKRDTADVRTNSYGTVNDEEGSGQSKDERYHKPRAKSDNGYADNSRAEAREYDGYSAAPRPETREYDGYSAAPRPETREPNNNYAEKPRSQDRADYNYSPPSARAPAQYEEEQPRVFATKRDKNVFVYEYSDRIEIYEKSWRGMTHVYTEAKKK